jgi:hypothetical protein
MNRSIFHARGPLTAALVLLFSAACSPPQPDPLPPPGTLESAVVALRRADISRLRSDLGKGKGCAEQASEFAKSLDPEAWLVAIGASSREYNLAAAARAMEAGDDEALASATGFNEQKLTADILLGGASIFTRRADGRKFFDSGDQPIDLLADLALPGLPAGCIAMEVTLWGNLELRYFRASYGLNAHGATNLQVVQDLATESRPTPGGQTRHEKMGNALPSTGMASGLDVTDLDSARFSGAAFTLVDASARIQRLRLARDADGWALIENEEDPQLDRLGRLRDERLDFIRRRCRSTEGASGRWPRGLHEISFEPRQLTDPASATGRLGWADHDDSPPADLQLGTRDGAYAVRSGRRAITYEGDFIWLP